jgi:hypothetical protein
MLHRSKPQKESETRADHAIRPIGRLPVLLVMVPAMVLIMATSIGCVTTHSEEALTWCGPATAQMIIENDSRSGCPSTILQEDLWTIIQDNRVDHLWDTDPIGMEKALELSCTGWSWVPVSDTNKSRFMHSVAYFIQKYDYPAALVLDTNPHSSYPAHAEHWVDVLSVITDQDPTTAPPGTTVGLEYVFYVDPSPPVLGDNAIIELVSGSTWLSRLAKVDKPTSTYHDRFVAVIEPPEVKGMVAVKREPTSGEIIPPKRAVELAMSRLRGLLSDQRASRMLARHDLSRVMKRYGLPSRRPMENLERARPLEPLLVNRKRAAYYVVPLSFEGSRFTNHAHAAIAINAYDGSFQELGLFEPTRYPSKKKMLELTRKHPRLRQEKVLGIELVYPDATPEAHRLMPLWKVRTEKRQILLTNQGEVIKQRKVQRPGENVIRRGPVRDPDRRTPDRRRIIRPRR